MMEALFTPTCRRWDAFEVNWDGVGCGQVQQLNKEEEEEEILIVCIVLDLVKPNWIMAGSN
jgi:hypothetical protein